MKATLIASVICAMPIGGFIRNAFLRASLMKMSERDLQEVNGPLPFGLKIVYDENGSHIGYHVFPLGPNEYRDRKTGELKWAE